MEPVTHLLTGACLSRTGLNRKAAYATLTMVIAAEFPDIDTLWSLRGPIEGFQHHRGITHTFLGLPFEAALIVFGVYALHRWRLTRAKNATLNPASTAPRKPLTAAPVRWGVLYVLALLALLSHLLLDYTNNYGLRPFFPFNDRWYAASIVFIFDPWMFLMLLSALVAPWLFALISAEVGAKKQLFRARGWASAALIGVVAWWSLRAVEHQDARQLAMNQSIAAPTPQLADPNVSAPDANTASNPPSPAPTPVPVYLPTQRALASPDILSPFRWSGALDFGPVYQLAEIDTLARTLVMGETSYPKPTQTAALQAAERSKLGRAYLDWSSMPLIELTNPSALSGPEQTAPGGVAHVITFRDLRFMGGWRQPAAHPPLEGVVELDSSNHVISQSMNGRTER